jgi:hypothetical protein
MKHEFYLKRMDVTGVLSDDDVEVEGLGMTDVELPLQLTESPVVDGTAGTPISRALFRGIFSCVYCEEKVASDSISDLIIHLMRYHGALKRSYFSCPACQDIIPLRWDEYLRHFKRDHQVIGVFEGYNRTRDAWSIALEAVICMDMTTSLDSSCVARQMVTAAGGYASLDGTNRRDDLVRSVKRKREKLRRTIISKLVKKTTVALFDLDIKQERVVKSVEYKEDPDDCVM